MSLSFAVSRAHGSSEPRLIAGCRQLVSQLAEEVKQPIELLLTNDYEEQLSAVLQARVDCAWMPPLTLARAVAGGARLIAVNQRGGAMTYRAGLLVRANSPLQSLNDVSRLRAAWSDPSSASGYLLPRLYLRASGIDLARAFASERFYGSASAACAAVADDDADLCASFVTEASAGRPSLILADVARVYAPAPQRLRMLAVTTSIPADGLVISRRVSEPDVVALTTAFLTLHQTPAGAAMLKDVMNSDRLVAPNAAIVRSIDTLQQQLRLLDNTRDAQ